MQAHRVLDAVGLKQIPVATPLQQLSGGYKRRVALAVQLVRRPAVSSLVPPPTLPSPTLWTLTRPRTLGQLQLVYVHWLGLHPDPHSLQTGWHMTSPHQKGSISYPILQGLVADPFGGHSVIPSRATSACVAERSQLHVS